MIFVILDIEIIFTYPWAVIYSHDLGKSGLVEMVVFTVAVFVSLLYLVSNGALDWGPVRKSPRPDRSPNCRSARPAPTVHRRAASAAGASVGVKRPEEHAPPMSPVAMRW